MHGPSLNRLGLAAALAAGLLVGPLHANPENPGASKNVGLPPLPVGAIAWRTSFEAAVAQAAKEEKPLLVDFETEWCGFCKKLDRETFGNADVIRFVQQYFVAVKVDGDKRADLRDRYTVEGYPTVVFLSPQAVELTRIVGYRPPDAFLAEAGKAARSSATLEKLRDEAASRPDDDAAQRAYARALFAAGNPSEAVERLTAYTKQHPKTFGVRLDLGDLLKATGRLEEACSQYEAALEGDAKSTEAERPQGDEERSERRSVHLSLARARLQLHQHEKSVSVLTRYLRGAKRDVPSPNVLEALFLRAYARATLGDADAALADLKEAEKLDTEGLWGLRASLIRELVEVRSEPGRE